MVARDDAEITAEIQRLDAAVRTAPAGDMTAQIALWRYVAGLPTWTFIARGTPEQPRPYGVAADQGPMICLYSTAERADEAARALGVVDGETGRASLLAVPMPAALDYVASFGAAGVFGVALDHPQIGHFIPLANLQFLKS